MAQPSISPIGGFDIAPVLGVSTDSRSKIGPAGKAVLQSAPEERHRCVTPRQRAPTNTELTLDTFCSQPFVLCPQPQTASSPVTRANASCQTSIRWAPARTAWAYAQRPVDQRHGFNIVSDAIVTGSIRPGSDLPIVLLADHQTTGGYPKIATVISAGHRQPPARLPIRSKISFAPVATGAALRRQHENLEGIGTLKDGSECDLPRQPWKRGCGMQSHQRRLRRRCQPGRFDDIRSQTRSIRKMTAAGDTHNHVVRGIMFMLGASVMFAISNAPANG